MAVSISDDATTSAQDSWIAALSEMRLKMASKKGEKQKIQNKSPLQMRLHGSNGPMRSGRHSGSKIEHTNS